MKLRIPRILTVLTITGSISFTALGISPLGAPRATIGDEKWSIGASLGHQNMDLKATGSYYEIHSGSKNPISGDFDIKSHQSTMFFGQAGYGINDVWDLYAIIGATDASGDAQSRAITPESTSGYIGKGETFKYSSSASFAWGLGTRVTFHETPELSWGGTAQLSYHDPSNSHAIWANPTQPAESLHADIAMKYWEVQIAVGPTFNMGSYWIYGGPFLHFINGDMAITGTWRDTAPDSGPINANLDLKQKSEVGFYLGGQWLMADNVYWYADGQVTGDAWGLGIGGLWRVE